MSLKSTKSEGYDSISTKIIKSCRENLLHILTFLVNLSLEQGVFPEKLKYSIVKPVHKKGNVAVVTNYRPITLIPIFSKIFEKVMYTKLISFLNHRDIIDKNQYGFQKSKSTTQAAFHLVNKVLHCVNDKRTTTALFLDMSSAFDLVCHHTLLKKLERYGIRGPAYHWLNSYLSNRKQSVEIDYLDAKKNTKTVRSDAKQIKYGVPQGSVISPLLFLLYINDISGVTKHEKILFADDISVVVASDVGTSIERHKTDIVDTLTLISNWLHNNNLQINLSKTNLINFNNFKDTNIDINFNGQVINNATYVTFLGIIIDKTLNWKDQIQRICNKLNSFAYALYKLSIVACRGTALTTYFAYVESVLRYGIVLWGNSTDFKKAFIAQKACIRAICHIAPDISCRPFFQQLKVLPLPCLYIFEIGKFVVYNRDKFIKASDRSNRPLRNMERLILDTIPKTKRFQKNCFAMCIKIYNHIPNHIKHLPKKQFESSLREWLLKKSFYTVEEFLKHKE